MPVLVSRSETRNHKKKVAFNTLGCKVNFSETATIAKGFQNENYSRVEFDQPADVYVINTCSVTQNADKKLHNLVRKANWKNPNAIVAVTGCYAQLQSQEIAQIDGVDLVVGTENKFDLPRLLNSHISGSNVQIHACEISRVNSFNESYSTDDRTRAFLKVQDGCNYKCSFCTIPRARGVSRSDTIENVLHNINLIKNKNIKEIVLTGINLGDFQQVDRDTRFRFFDLLNSIASLNDIPRIRISSIEPNLLDNRIIELVSENEVFVPHFHIPLQSGSDPILRRMRRRYDTDLYASKVQKIKSLMPDACIGVDVMVGFFGETEKDFQTTYDFLSQLDVSYLHVFTYSERPATTALNLSNPVPIKARKRRNKILRVLSEEKRLNFYQKQLGKNKTVLFETANCKEYLMGYTENYVRIKAPWEPSLPNTLRLCNLKGINSDGNVLCQVLNKNSRRQ